MEKYGEIPPRFTKKWWSYFWEYYKLWVIIPSAAALLTVMMVAQCVNRPRYDLTITYAGHMNYSEREREAICEIASQYISDIDGDGEKTVLFQPLQFSDGAGQEEYDFAIQTKLDLTMVDEYTYIYLMDEVEAKLYMRRDTIADMFENTNLYAQDAQGETLRGEIDGAGYAVSLSGSRLLKENNIACDDLYIMVRVNNKDDEREKASHDGAIALAGALVSSR